MRIEHFSHPHPLLKEKRNPSTLFYATCSACRKTVSHRGPRYDCLYSCDFYLHEQCALLERVIHKHPEHIDHPLLLTHKPDQSDRFICNGCSTACCGFFYRCSKCNFNLDLECVFKNPSTPTITFQHEGHKLFLSHQPMFHDLGCQVCDGDLELPMFKCKDLNCLYAMHVHCAPFAYPETAQYKHLHTLVYCKKFTEGSSVDDYYCDACEERRYPYTPVYNCLQCFSASAPYTAHISCALSHQVLQSLVEEYESSQRGKSPHYHPHHLTLIDDYEHDSGKKCTVCKSTLGKESSPILLCEQCGFHLHDHCRKMETELKHPTHPQDSLTLHVDATHVGPFFQCNACKETCHCFIYHCTSCSFNLCVRCYRWIDTKTMFNYQNHKLFLLNSDARRDNCDFCESDKASPRFVCMEPGCTFNLHFFCAPFPFPKTFKYWNHEHHLSLMNDSLSNRCDICNEVSYEHDRSYLCGPCNYGVHAFCALRGNLPALIAEFENSSTESKVERLNTELKKLQMEEKVMDAQLTEIDYQLTEKSKSIEDIKIAISQLLDETTASSE